MLIKRTRGRSYHEYAVTAHEPPGTRSGGAPHVIHDGTTKWRFVLNAFEMMQSQAGGDPSPVLRIIKAMCHPLEYVNDPARHSQILERVNKVLAFSGLIIQDDGKLAKGSPRARKAPDVVSNDERAFDLRGFHAQVVKHAKTQFCRGAYFHAVFECCKAFDSAVRSNTGLTKSGRELMSQALSDKEPVKFNAQQTVSEQNEQEGLMFLGMGLMAAVRNPQAHEPELEWPMSKEDALDLLGLISFLFRKFEAALVLSPEAKGTTRVQL